MTPPHRSETGLLLPESTRLLHIGPQKTGTTALQVAMHRTRPKLREHGVVYPGRGTRPREGVWAALGLDVPGFERAPRIEKWHDLVREVEQAGDLRVCVSTEDFAKTDLTGARKVVDELGGDRAHVVAVARNLDRLLPSQWQQRVKMRQSSLLYEKWLEIVLDDRPDDPVWQNVWRPHDIKALVERWVTALGSPERFTLVVADESDRRLLPRTFEEMLGLPDGLLDIAVTGVDNRSLGIGRIEAVRQLNGAFESHAWPTAIASEQLHTRLTDTLRKDALWPEEDPLPPLPRWAAERVTELSIKRAELVRSLGVRVVGDPSNLLSQAMLSDPQEYRVPMVSAALAVRALEVAIESAAEMQQEHSAKHARQVQQLRDRLKRARERASRPPDPDQIAGRELARALGRRVLQRLSRRS